MKLKDKMNSGFGRTDVKRFVCLNADISYQFRSLFYHTLRRHGFLVQPVSHRSI